MSEPNTIDLSNSACLEHEAELTRLLLGKAASSNPSWAPPGSSRSLGSLAAHLAEIPKWTLNILEATYYDFAEAALVNDSGRATRGGPPPAASRDELLGALDANTRLALDALKAATEDQLSATWSLRRASKTIESMPRALAIRRFVIDHMIHHRGQLTVYLRMLGRPVPGLYGPSADEPYVGELPKKT